MPDKLNELFEAWKATLAADATPTDLQLFQGGLSIGAAAMRSRAQRLAQEIGGNFKEKNDLINAIGSLPDIPKE